MLFTVAKNVFEKALRQDISDDSDISPPMEKKKVLQYSDSSENDENLSENFDSVWENRSFCNWQQIVEEDTTLEWFDFLTGYKTCGPQINNLNEYF